MSYVILMYLKIKWDQSLYKLTWKPNISVLVTCQPFTKAYGDKLTVLSAAVE